MGSRQRVAYDSLARRGRGMAENQHPTVQDGLVHILSMGHRLQTLSFDKGAGTVRCCSRWARQNYHGIARPPRPPPPPLKLFLRSNAIDCEIVPFRHSRGGVKTPSNVGVLCKNFLFASQDCHMFRVSRATELGRSECPLNNQIDLFCMNTIGADKGLVESARDLFRSSGV